MEFLLGFALMIILMLLMGFGIADIAVIVLGLVGLLIVFIGLFFLVCLIMLIFTDRTRGAFVEFNEDGRFPCAVYDIGGERVKNLFPCEMIMRGRLYVPGREIKLLYFKPRRFALDKNALLTIIIGSTVFIPGAVLSAVTFVKLISAPSLFEVARSFV